MRARAAALTTGAIVVLLVGASRIYLGAHWLTDVLAGYALAGAWLALLAALRQRQSRLHPRRPDKRAALSRR